MCFIEIPSRESAEVVITKARTAINETRGDLIRDNANGSFLVD